MMGTIWSDDRTHKLQYDNKTMQQLSWDMQTYLGEVKSELDTNITNDLDEFYAEVKPWIHPKTNEEVLTLADYQHTVWNDRFNNKNRMYLKSQKIGLSMLLLLECMHIAVTNGRGKQIIIVAQTKEKALTHIRDLEEMFQTSPRFSSWHISTTIASKEADEITLKQRSVGHKLLIRNPDNPSVPTEIIVGTIRTPSQLISHKRIIHILCSDIASAEVTAETFERAWTGLTSRLANTEGTTVVESLPRGTKTPIYNLAYPAIESLPAGTDLDEEVEYRGKRDFLIRRLTYRVAVRAGLISQEWIDAQREENLEMFKMYYEASFFISDMLYFDSNRIKQTSEEAGVFYDK